jgi:hypothetical protein
MGQGSECIATYLKLLLLLCDKINNAVFNLKLQFSTVLDFFFCFLPCLFALRTQPPPTPHTAHLLRFWCEISSFWKYRLVSDMEHTNSDMVGPGTRGVPSVRYNNRSTNIQLIHNTYRYPRTPGMIIIDMMVMKSIDSTY